MTKARTLADNFAADINAITAGTGITGGGTSGTVTVTNEMATTITAKGDLLAGTGNAAFDNLAAGASGETLVADSSSATGLRYQGSMAAGRNFLINGAFDIWQRGTSFASGGTGVYTADRWENTQSGNITGSQQTTGAPNGSRFYFRQTATNTGGFYTLIQYVETANTVALQGRTVIASVRLRRNATFNASTFFVIEKNATVDAGNGAGGWSAIATTTIEAASISVGTTANDWTLFTVTATIPNDNTANTVRVRHAYNSNPANGSILEFAQFMLELGSVPTTFSRAGATIQGELAACQRYYFRMQDGNNGAYGGGIALSTSQFNAAITTPVTMRVIPTVLDFSALRGVLYGVSGHSVSAATISSADSTKNVVMITCTTSGLVQKQFLPLTGDGAGTHLGLGAEL